MEDSKEKVEKPAAFKNILFQRSTSGQEEYTSIAAPSDVDSSNAAPSIVDPSDIAPSIVDPSDTAPSVKNVRQDKLNKAVEAAKKAFAIAAVEEKNKEDIKFCRSTSRKEKNVLGPKLFCVSIVHSTLTK